MKTLFLPLSDYFYSRKRLSFKYALAGIPAIVALGYTLIFNVSDGVDIVDVFTSFINVQISMVAIFISFSIAIITILVTADNENIRNLKKREASEKRYKCLNNGKKLTLFQVLLSDVAYSVSVQLIYLTLLVVELFIKIICPVSFLKYLTAINIFFVVHIIFILAESVTNLYLVFWKDYSLSGARVPVQKHVREETEKDNS